MNKLLITLLLVLTLAVAGCGEIKMTENTHQQVEIITNKGTIVVELNETAAPGTVANFLQYVDDDFYNQTVFHRVIQSFMVQGGGFTADGRQKKTRGQIPIESDNGLKNMKYTIAMARTNVPDSATSQFFINTKDNNFLDYTAQNPGYTVFGKVVEGMDVVDAIEQVQTASRPMPDWPVDAVVIETIKRK